MKRLFILTFAFCAIGIAHAQYFSGNQPGLPLLGKASPIDGGALTNLNAGSMNGNFTAPVIVTNAGVATTITSNSVTTTTFNGAGTGLTGIPVSALSNAGSIGVVATNQLAFTNCPTFDAVGAGTAAAKAITNGAANPGVFIVFTGTNGLFYTNRIINGVIQ